LHFLVCTNAFVDIAVFVIVHVYKAQFQKKPYVDIVLKKWKNLNNFLNEKNASHVKFFPCIKVIVHIYKFVLKNRIGAVFIYYLQATAKLLGF
uniref:Uncharacterized protein n=1 Tax=Ciona intestinalis TaxID=7719 RepID=H2XJG4_CIOIN